MDVQTAYDMMAEDALIAGMRGNFPPETALRVVETLLEEGIRVLEFTMNSVQPIASMQAVKREFGDAVCSGMGTVLDTDTANRVLEAGADFIVSPAFQPPVVQVVLEAQVFFAPGVTTPSEAVAAWDMGVPMLKLFPIGPLGLPYFKSLIGPLDHMKFMCNGGTNADNVGEFLEAGAVACGLASWLTGNGTMSLDSIRVRARQLQAVVNKVRGVPRTI
jgi:2-dehydro-3-deoxyphosphogluconate aldolase/(4S)-4-hydroxy-2-oxoglutarate aldolase